MIMKRYGKPLSINLNNITALNNKENAFTKLEKCQKVIWYCDKTLKLDPKLKKVVKSEKLLLKS